MFTKQPRGLKCNFIITTKQICYFGLSSSINNPFRELASLVLSILSLPLSNAEIERVFSQMNVVKTKLRNRMSLATLNSFLHVRYGLRRSESGPSTSQQDEPVDDLPRITALKPKLFSPVTNQKRSFWEYVNMMFNKPDPDRIKLVGPDRACAEWVLRNGGRVVWVGGKKLADYNSLPPESQAVPKLIEIDGTDSSISHYGFSHLSGCTMLERIILHNDLYIDDRALKGLSYGRDTLTHVQVSNCADVTDSGVKEIKVLDKLKTLVLFDLKSVVNLEECKQTLQSQLPNCKITGAVERLDQ